VRAEGEPRFQDRTLERVYRRMRENAAALHREAHPVLADGRVHYRGGSRAVAFAKGYDGFTMREALVVRGSQTHAAWAAGCDERRADRQAAR
jgi:hypothetical protein